MHRSYHSITDRVRHVTWYHASRGSLLLTARLAQNPTSLTPLPTDPPQPPDSPAPTLLTRSLTPPHPPRASRLNRFHRAQPTGYTGAEISSASGAHVRASLLVLQRCKNSTTTTTTSTGTGATSKGAPPTPTTAGVAPRDSRALTCRSCQGHLETRTEASGGSSVRCANCSSDWVPAAFGANVSYPPWTEI